MGCPRCAPSGFLPGQSTAATRNPQLLNKEFFLCHDDVGVASVCAEGPAAGVGDLMLVFVVDVPGEQVRVGVHLGELVGVDVDNAVASHVLVGRIVGCLA